ncbi:hypothetical protein HNR46_002552 [Haloferula luteola]|uniref:Uncharacterized protein n=1 Tax=Haloferula luteola TaxID=595692 RepID=A0A840VEQ0_9BACT|nr:hypothetical protein [Haloferula luteola]MBB5352309.1 hypothetical protein [Haloferula luteola]
MMARPFLNARRLVLAMAPGLVAGAHAQDFIRQIQVIDSSSVIYDIPISSDNGEVLSEPLAGDSAVFQLYATATLANNVTELKKLDEKTVGTYLPKVTVEILSEDPYDPPRTRADQTYGVRIKIAGLRADPDAPAEAKQIQVVRRYRLYDDETFEVVSEGSQEGTYTFDSNGNFVDNAISQRLPGDPDLPTKVAGEESFVAMTQGGPGGSTSEMASATVQIWPVAEAAFFGIEAGKTYQGLPPVASILLRDLYPNSTTYVQVYKGPQRLGVIGDALPTSVLHYETYLPQKANLALTDLNSFLAEDGEYTLEALTMTPFNDGAPELLASISFIIDRTLNVNGMISTAE